MSNNIAYIQTFVNNRNQDGSVEPKWITAPKLVDGKIVPGKPLISLAGPFPVAIAEGFMRARREHNLHSPTVWKILTPEEAKVATCTQQIFNRM